MSESDPLGLVGTTIDGKYQVERVVGEGGFAVVYRAIHLVWKRPVAIKVFSALAEFKDEDRKRLVEGFIQEGSLLADLSELSAAICQARDIGTFKSASGAELPFMVLEWLEGATLEDVLRAELAAGLPRRSIEETLALLDPIAEALALAHRKGVAHRDVKPANIFVVGDARGSFNVKLLDFGIAKVVSDAQKMSGSFGKTAGHITSFTPAYGAPEQFSRTHGATGPWTDVFALALVASEVLAGRVPLEGDSLVQLAFSSADVARRPTPRALGATVTDAVEAVFSKALAVVISDRWADAASFWNALHAAASVAPLRSLTVPASPSSSNALAAVATAPTLLADGTGATQLAPAASAAPPSSSPMGVFAIVAAVAVACAGAYFVVQKMLRPSTTGDVPMGSVASASSSALAAPSPCPSSMVEIPAGEFFMGSNDADALPQEKPTHHVTIDAYCIDRTEVTTAAYVACNDAGKCPPPPTVNTWPERGDKGLSAIEKKAFDPLCNVNDKVGRAQHPINCIDWENASAFCHAQGARLPTEAEWEFAARGPAGRKYPWGDEQPSARLLNACGAECVAWMKEHGLPVEQNGAKLVGAMYADDDRFATTAPVGSFPAGRSMRGLDDVVGNVWEWVSDYYGDYAKDEQKNPHGPVAGTERVIRGGAWNGVYPTWVRPTFRYKDDPMKRSYAYGVRCAKSIEAR